MNDAMNGENPNNESPDQLDDLLDKSLAQYSQVSPLTGLEDRILARLENAVEEPAPWWGAGVIAWQRWGVPVTAVVLVGGIAIGGWLVTSPGEDIDDVGENTEIEVNGGVPVEAATAPLPARIPLEAFRASSEKLAGLFGANPLVKLDPNAEVRGSYEPSAVGQEVFPSPAPLSEQERLALAYARTSQQLPVATAAAVPEPGIRELEVPSLQVAPLKVEELKKPGTDGNKITNPTK